MVLPHNPLERRTLMSTTILSFQNRVVIETLHNEGRSLRYIANYLGFSKTTLNTWSRKRFKSRSGPLNKLPMWLGLPTRRSITGLIKAGLIYSCPICLIMEFVVIVLKKSVVRSVTAAQLRRVLIKSKLARNSATLKLIPYFWQT